MAIIGVDLGKKDGSKTVYGLHSNGEYFRMCKDYDGDCEDVKDKSWCWMDDPCQGICPYLFKEQ